MLKLFVAPRSLRKRFQSPNKFEAAIAVLLMGCIIGVGTSLLGSPAQNQRNGTHGAIELDCKLCHNTTGYKPIRPFPDFDHKSTRFPLEGKHKGLECTQCHVKLVFSSVGKQCSDCHADIHRRQFGSNCEECHS